MISIRSGKRLGRDALCLLASFSGAHAQLFTAPSGSPFTAGRGPESVAVADFNGDGKPDLAIASSVTNNVTVLLGDGAGGFTAAPGSPFPAGSSPAFVAVADFNGDGKPDLVIADYQGNDVTLLLGDGSGGFAAAAGSPFQAGAQAASLAVADFNKDGKPDLAIANYGGSNVTVLLGDGDGGFNAASGSPFNAGTNPNYVAAGDFNGDGKPDLAIANQGSNNVTVLLGDGSGGFTAASASPFQVGSMPGSLAAGDVNGDGKQDLIATNLADATVTVLLGNGSGGFTAALDNPFATGRNPASVAVADFNGDGFRDLVIANSVDGTLTVLLGDGSGGFTAASGNPFPVGTSPFQVAVGDFNRDGQPDVATANNGGNNATVLVNTLPPITANPAVLTFYAGVGQAAPNGILVTASSLTGGSTYTAASNQPWLTPNPTSNATGQGTTVLLSASQTSLTAGTYSGVARVTAPNFFDGATAVTFNVANPSGTLTAGPDSPLAAPDPYSVAVGDFNGDGKPDLAIGNYSDNVTVLLGNGSGGFTAAPGSPFPAGTDPSSVAVADFNGDGIQDLVIADQGSTVTVLLGDGAGAFTAAPDSPFPAGDDPVSVAVGDFNGDGIPDLAIADYGSSKVTVLLGDGHGGFTAAAGSPFPADQGSISVAVGDFNGDGKQDLAIAEYYGDDVTVLLGNGYGGFTAASGSPFSVGGARPYSVAVGDFNADGKQDLALANSVSGNITVLLGDGSGGFAPASGSPFQVGESPQSVAVGDFNGDGRPDLAVPNAGDNTLTVLLGDGSGGFAAAPGSPFTTGVYPSALAVGDFNRDGRPDVAIANSSNADVSVLLGALATTRSVLSTTSPATVNFGTAVSLTLDVSDSVTAFFSAPTGTATFLDGAVMLGTATSPYTFTTSSLGAGSHTLTATYAGDTRSASSTSNAITIQVIALSQTITFVPLPDIPPSTASFVLTAAASSGLGVMYVSNTTSVCTVSGSMVTIVESGGCSITASQMGSTTYAPAAPVTQDFTVLFSDISPSDSYAAVVDLFAQYGITAGCGNDDFCANGLVTRAEMAIFIITGIFRGADFSYSATPHFADVQPGTFGFKWIQAMYELGITAGCGGGNYCPNGSVTREAMAVFIIVARFGAGASFTYSSTPSFNDVPDSGATAPYFKFVQRMKRDGITAGCAKGLYCPDAAVTRAQMAVFMMAGLFNQFLPAGTPLITGISPSVLPVGSSGTFTITGVNTSFMQGTTMISPISGVTIGAITVSSPTSLTVQLTAAANATLRPYSIVAITNSEQDVFPNSLIIQ